MINKNIKKLVILAHSLCTSIFMVYGFHTRDNLKYLTSVYVNSQTRSNKLTCCVFVEYFDRYWTIDDKISSLCCFRLSF